MRVWAEMQSPDSSPTVAFLLTVFSVRLGSWFQNPRRPDIWRKPGPSHSLKPLLSELFGMSNDRSDFVYLSDGGHFENLAIYELIRRRLRLIVVTDGGADEKYTFEDLQNAIHRVAEDFGAKIAFERPFWMPDQPGHCSRPWRNRLADMVPRDLEGFPLDVKYAEFGFIIGTINYGPAAGGVAGGAPDYGIIILMKTTMLSGLSIATRGYKGANPDFPDETTADQFFDEYQFEAYRALGYRTAEQMIEGAQLARLIHTIRQVAA